MTKDAEEPTGVSTELILVGSRPLNAPVIAREWLHLDELIASVISVLLTSRRPSDNEPSTDEQSADEPSY